MNMKDKISNLMEQLVCDIEKKCNKNEVPVGAMIIDKEGNIVSECFNNRQDSRSVLGHAEILAIETAEKKVGDWRLDGYSMIVSLKPCDLCCMVICECRIDHVFYLLDKNESGKYPDLYTKLEKLDINSELEKKYNKLLTDFFASKR